MDREQQILADLAEIEAQMKEHQENNRIEFFEPFYYQKKVLDLIHAGKKVVTLQGANSIGKTVLGACVTGSGGLGIQPWDGKETRWGQKAIRARIICSDWEKHAKEVIVPKLKEWLPQGTYTTSKNNVGVESSWTFDTGSTIEILTNKQSTEDHEGWEGDLVWADEPFGRDKFVANLRGLRRDDKGLFLITMTAVSEAWILDDIVLNPHHSYASVTEIPQKDNPTLSKDYLETFAASLQTEAEKIPRLYGGWLNLVGLVWPGFRQDTIQDKVSHIVDPFDIPTDWPVVPMVDYHPSHPQALSYFTVDPQDRMFYIDEVWGPKWSPEMVADDIIRKKKEHTWRITDAFIDPLSKGDTTYIKNRGLEIPDSYSVMKEKLWREGVELHVASKDQSSGIVNVEKMLNGVNGLPTLFFFRNLDKIPKEGILWEIRRWTYQDGKPKVEHNHFCENLYRMTLTGTKYTEPRRRGEELVAETEFRVFG